MVSRVKRDQGVKLDLRVRKEIRDQQEKEEKLVQQEHREKGE
jgi:hypothetical protein